jgi:hypothetical protein
MERRGASRNIFIFWRFASRIYSEAIAGLSWSEYPEHPHVARRLVAVCVGADLVERTVAAATWQLAYAGVWANGVSAGMLAKPLE